tara:strand:+ start:715 stop:1728 length:1014 start_codon:yes stop_codon:yes gene_type:complete
MEEAVISERNEWIEYLNKIRPDLSDGSRKAYATQLVRITGLNNLKETSPLFLLNRLANKTIRDRTLKFIFGEVLNNQTKNLRVASVLAILKESKSNMEDKKYIKLFNTLKSVGTVLREEIQEANGNNEKNEKEIKAMTTSWDELEEFASSYHSLTPTADRDYIMLNLLLNNYEVKDDIKYNVLLRTIEYATLHIWTTKRKPPDDHKNYLWIAKNLLYIQHSKTTGGIKTNGRQAIYKTYPVSEALIDKIKIYIKTNKLKNKQPLFWNENNIPLTNNYFGKIFKDLLKPLNDHLTIGMIRKIYENRPIPENLTGNQIKKLNKLVDHSMEIAQIFYKKI